MSDVIKLPRQGRVTRQTRETQIEASLALDGSGAATVTTGIGLLDHMISTFCWHAQFDITLACHGDLVVDDHHSAEDCAIALGQALRLALGERNNLVRFAHALVPMEETLARAVVDLAARPWTTLNLRLKGPQLGKIATENVEHFFRTLVSHAFFTLHLDVMRGQNDHHRAEAAFKALALALRTATREMPLAGANSVKGVL